MISLFSEYTDKQKYRYIINFLRRNKYVCMPTNKKKNMFKMTKCFIHQSAPVAQWPRSGGNSNKWVGILSKKFNSIEIYNIFLALSIQF